MILGGLVSLRQTPLNPSKNKLRIQNEDEYANSAKSTKSTKNPIARSSFQRNRYSSTCTAKSPIEGLIMAVTGILVCIKE